MIPVVGILPPTPHGMFPPSQNLSTTHARLCPHVCTCCVRPRTCLLYKAQGIFLGRSSDFVQFIPGAFALLRLYRKLAPPPGRRTTNTIDGGVGFRNRCGGRQGWGVSNPGSSICVCIYIYIYIICIIYV